MSSEDDTLDFFPIVITDKRPREWHWSPIDEAPPHLHQQFTREQLWPLSHTAKLRGWEWAERNLEWTFSPSPGFRSRFNEDQQDVLDVVARSHGWLYVETYYDSILGQAENVLGPLAPSKSWTPAQLAILKPVAKEQGWPFTEDHAQEILADARQRARCRTPRNVRRGRG